MKAIWNVKPHKEELPVSTVIEMKILLESYNYAWFRNKVDTSKELPAASTTHRISVRVIKGCWLPSMEIQRKKVLDKVHLMIMGLWGFRAGMTFLLCFALEESKFQETWDLPRATQREIDPDLEFLSSNSKSNTVF